MAGLIQRFSSALCRTSPAMMRSMLPKVISFAANRNITTSYCGNPELLSLSSTKDSRWQLVRNYSAKEPLSLKLIQERVTLVLQLYDKIDVQKLSLDAHFLNDLGLDSLDHVEVIMAMEDEFGFEIPDGDAEKLIRPKDIVRYIADKEDIYD